MVVNVAFLEDNVLLGRVLRNTKQLCRCGVRLVLLLIVTVDSPLVHVQGSLYFRYIKCPNPHLFVEAVRQANVAEGNGKSWYRSGFTFQSLAIVASLLQYNLITLV